MYWIQQLTIVYKKKDALLYLPGCKMFVPYTLDSGRGETVFKVS